MDNLTHSLFGLALARSGLARKYGKGTTSLLVVASNVPDVDALLLLTHGESAAWLRRTHSHCVVGAPLLALGLAVLWWLATRKRIELGRAFGLALLGAAGHVGLDLLNSYGVVALWPFTTQRYELAWAYIIDLAMLGMLLVPVLLRRWAGARDVLLNRIALGAFLAYVGACAAGRAQASALLASHLRAEGARPAFTYVFPEALGPHRWRAVAREGDRYRSWLVHVLQGRLELKREDRTDEALPRLRPVRATERAQDVERFFKAPVWTVEADGLRATCFDLRFVSFVIGRGTPFRYEFPLGPEP